jgi:hypothetical protein
MWCSEIKIVNICITNGSSSNTEWLRGTKFISPLSPRLTKSLNFRDSRAESRHSRHGEKPIFRNDGESLVLCNR